MNTLTTMVWSMSLGAIAAVAVTRLADYAARPNATQLRAVGYHLGVFLLVLVESGMLQQAAHPDPALLHVAQVLAGPACVGVSTLWIQGWLGVARRDWLMCVVLRAAALGLPALGAAALTLPHELQLPAGAAIALAGSALTSWVAFRAWILGDRLALWMAAGCLLTLPAIAGLYAVAMRLGPLGWQAQAAVALAAALCNGLTGAVLWQRERHEWRTRETGSAPALDPVTKVHSSAALVQRMVASQKRRLRTRRPGALLAVTVFEPERIATLAGPAAVNEVWMTLAARLQRQVGVVNPVGRYWDRCFVALVESIASEGALRTLGLRVACALRQPVEVSGRNGEPLRVRVELGVGVVQLRPGHGEPEDVLDTAQRLAQAARGMASRAAITDPLTGESTAVEQARIETRKRRPFVRVARPLPAVHRAAR
ncbi:7TM diverse intracellular signaling domain-containing protein [Ramlibacter sp. PS3R-8]|uniref:7TM diverse intracellular signaling domain-containing protein n=1 Tax=Ramlibacter sp. PS3R-8 TaxID=3133437 RepID=UPI0030A0DB00